MKPLKTKVSITLDENVIQPIRRKTKFYSHTLCTLAFNTDSLSAVSFTFKPFIFQNVNLQHNNSHYITLILYCS